MDKRTLIFLVCVTCSFFCVNIFFSYYDNLSNKEWYDQQEQLRTQKQQQLEESIAERTVSADQLPIVQVFQEEEDRIAIGVGVVTGQHLIVLGKDKAWPETIVAQGTQSYKLLNKDKHRTYAIYYNEENFPGKTQENTQKTTELPLLKGGVLSNLGSYDLQIVSLQDADGVTLANSFLADYIDGHLSFPSEAPIFDAIALKQEGDGFSPVGFYRADKKRFIPLDQSAFKKYMKYPKNLFNYLKVREMKSFMFWRMPFSNWFFLIKGELLLNLTCHFLPKQINKV